MGHRPGDVDLAQRQGAEVDGAGLSVESDGHHPATSLDELEGGTHAWFASTHLVHDPRSEPEAPDDLCRFLGLAGLHGVRCAERGGRRQPFGVEVGDHDVGAELDSANVEERPDPAGTDDQHAVARSRLALAHRVHGDRHRLGECGRVLEQSERFGLDASAGGKRTELGEASVALQPDSRVAVTQVRPTFTAVAAHGT